MNPKASRSPSRWRASPRPLTHQLTAALLSAAAVDVQAATITRLVDVVFHATITVVRDGVATEVDARPSDALTLASLTGADIHVASAVLRDGHVPRDATEVADAAQIIADFRERHQRHVDAAADG